MTINKTILYDRFEFYSYELRDLAENVLSRMESPDDSLYACMDDELIYYDDQWTMIKAYCTPQEANYDYAWACFYDDLTGAIMDGVLEEDEE